MRPALQDREEVKDLALLGLLVLDGALLGLFGLVFSPLYHGPVPVPMGALMSILVLPWLVRSAGEIDPRTGAAAAPLLAWVLVVAVVGFTGPGGDVMLPVTWQSLLLVVGGLGSGMWALQRTDRCPLITGSVRQRRDVAGNAPSR